MLKVTMPPPKKPKSGPTTIEQFMSNDELKTDEVRERTGSCSGNSEASDTSVVSGKSIASDVSNGMENERRDDLLEECKAPGLKLLRELIIKKREEEQRVPGSYVSTDGSAKSESPADLYNATEQEKTVSVLDVVSAKAKQEAKSGKRSSSPISPLAGSVLPRGSFDKSSIRDKTGSRLLNSILAPTITTPISTTGSHFQNYFSPYLYGQSLPGTCIRQDAEMEPRDLSLKPDKENNNLESRLLNENLQRDIQERLSLQFGMGSYSATTDKEYLDSRKNLVGILTEPRYNHLGFPIDRDSSIGSFPFFVNGLESRRDAVSNLIPKEEAGHHPMVGSVVSQGSYIGLPHVMPNYTSTSAGVVYRDNSNRLLPILDPSISYSEGRRLRAAYAGTGANSTNRLCQVCNDNASGFHYGVWSCEGCKAFFKRSIQGPVDYVCPATNTCTIDKHRRKSCQACRLRKCYEVGMNKGTQRKERKGSLSSMSTKQQTTAKRSRADSSDNTVNSTSGSPNPPKNARRSQTTVILAALNKAELPMLEGFHNHNLPPTKLHLLNSLIKLAERELVHLINWAKNVPGYTDLSLGDQVHLIECCWMELLLLNRAFRSREQDGNRLVFAPDLILDRSMWAVVGMTEIFEQVAAVSEQMVHLNVHKDEFLLLQATVLVNAEARRLESYVQIHHMRQSLLDAIVDTAQKYHPDNLRHVPSLLLLLTHIRQAGERAIAYFQKLKYEGAVNFCDLLKEMLDAQDFMERVSGNQVRRNEDCDSGRVSQPGLGT
ncbi:hypothetical protein FSP39_014570 [Pinctada imbricata]|uniref:Estrogen receptor n=1 Tax=Pinctada imbricata TaxID=66713 RepID=A0AA88XWL3_PINIB|nr:hypothetical protein FSP39_014570 [Pinctada imbricata]